MIGVAWLGTAPPLSPDQGPNQQGTAVVDWSCLGHQQGEKDLHFENEDEEDMLEAAKGSLVEREEK